jgi:hypothetical protein
MEPWSRRRPYAAFDPRAETARSRSYVRLRLAHGGLYRQGEAAFRKAWRGRLETETRREVLRTGLQGAWTLPSGHRIELRTSRDVPEGAPLITPILAEAPPVDRGLIPSRYARDAV